MQSKFDNINKTVFVLEKMYIYNRGTATQLPTTQGHRGAREKNNLVLAENE